MQLPKFQWWTMDPMLLLISHEEYNRVTYMTSSFSDLALLEQPNNNISIKESLSTLKVDLSDLVHSPWAFNIWLGLIEDFSLSLYLVPAALNVAAWLGILIKL